MSALAQIRMENPARARRKVATGKKSRGKKNAGELLIFGNPKKKGFGNHRAGCGCKFCDRAAKLQSGELKPPKLPNHKKARNSKKLDAQRGARERSARIRTARLNPGEYYMSYGPNHRSAQTLKQARKIAKQMSRQFKYDIEIIHGGDVVGRAKYSVKRANPKRNAEKIPDRWLQGRTLVLRRQGLSDREALIQATRDWKEQERLAKNPKRATRGRRRADRNPSETKQAVRLFQGFHGHDPKEIAEKHVSAAVRLDYAAIGDLIYVKTLTPLDEKAEFTFDGDGVKLASSPDGKQLYCIGGNQNILPLLEDRSAEKDFIDMGECLEVAYLARKIHGDFRPVEYYHEFGEINGMRPRLMFDKVRKQLFFIGGDYFIDVTMRAPGTPLGKVSPGIEN